MSGHFARRHAPSLEPASRDSRQALAAPPQADPNHHLWRNGRLWWIAFTVHRGHRQERIRRSLGTSDVARARLLRDELLARFAGSSETELALRFPVGRTGCTRSSERTRQE